MTLMISIGLNLSTMLLKLRILQLTFGNLEVEGLLNHYEIIAQDNRQLCYRGKCKIMLS